MGRYAQWGAAEACVDVQACKNPQPGSPRRSAVLRGPYAVSGSKSGDCAAVRESWPARRAAEIAHLIWQMVVDPSGDIATTLELQDRVAKKGSGRVIPLHPELREALIRLREQADDTNGPVVVSERGGPMRPIGIVAWFARAYRAIGLTGCSSHSG